VTDSYANLRALYAAAQRDEEPAASDRRAVRAGIIAAGVAAATLHAPAAAGKLIALVPGGAKVLTLGQVFMYAGLGVALGGGVAVVGFTAQQYAATQTASAVAAPAQRAPRAVMGPSGPARAIEPAEVLKPALLPVNSVDATPTATPLAPETTRNAPAVLDAPLEQQPPAPHVTAAPKAQSLRAESRGLIEVQVALSAGNISRALQLLDQQDQAFQAGSLAQERAAARVIALCSGQRAGAESAKERFLSAYPGSPLSRRINASCKKP